MISACSRILVQEVTRAPELRFELRRKIAFDQQGLVTSRLVWLERLPWKRFPWRNERDSWITTSRLWRRGRMFGPLADAKALAMLALEGRVRELNDVLDFCFLPGIPPDTPTGRRP